MIFNHLYFSRAEAAASDRVISLQDKQISFCPLWCTKPIAIPEYDSLSFISLFEKNLITHHSCSLTLVLFPGVVELSLGENNFVGCIALVEMDKDSVQTSSKFNCLGAISSF